MILNLSKKWNNATDLSEVNDSIENEIIFSTEVLKSNLCDYNDAYILVRGNIPIVGDNENHVEFIKLVHNSLSVSQKLMEKQ